MRRVLAAVASVCLLGAALSLYTREEVVFFTAPMQPAAYSTRGQAVAAYMMAGKKPLAPKGAFGGYTTGPDDDDKGWIGDNSKGTQVQKFEAGEDFLFFQGPAPNTAVQPDLPSFLSLENFQNLESPNLIAQIAVTLTGLASFAACAYIVVTG